MADPLRLDALDAQAITAAFAGNASATARALRVPCKAVIKAVQFVTAERDWLLSLWEAGAICRSQCERLAVLLDLCPLDAHRLLQAEDVRKAAQTLPAHVHLQSGEVHSALASIVINLLPDGRASISSTCVGKPDALYAPLDDEKAPKEVQKLLAELRERLGAISKEAHSTPVFANIKEVADWGDQAWRLLLCAQPDRPADPQIRPISLDAGAGAVAELLGSSPHSSSSREFALALAAAPAGALPSKALSKQGSEPDLSQRPPGDL